MAGLVRRAANCGSGRDRGVPVGHFFDTPSWRASAVLLSIPLSIRLALLLTLIRPLMPAALASPPRAPTLTVVGDVNFAGYPDSIRPFEGAGTLLAADLRIANAEGLLTDTPVTAYREARLDITAPAASARHFEAFDLIGLANNHTWDGGAAALLDQLATFAALERSTFGAAPTRAAAYGAMRYRWDGASFVAAAVARPPCLSVLGATMKSNRRPQPGAHAALVTTDSTRAETLDLVRAEHTRGCFVLVALHGGREGAAHPDPKTRAFGLALLDAGADLVAGHHPHVLQGVELRRPGGTSIRGQPGSSWPSANGDRLQAVAWSLGNFVFRNRSPEKRQTAVLHATLVLSEGRLTLGELSLLPAHSDRALLPRPATEREARTIARIVAERSALYGTEVKLASSGRITLR